MDYQFPIESCNFTIVEAASHLKVSRSQLYKLIGAKQIKIAKVGTRTIVPGAEVVRFVKALAKQAA